MASRAVGDIAIPGARAIDHCGFVVPDLEQAVAFFSEVLGAALLWRSERTGLGEVGAAATFAAAPGAEPKLAMLRLGPNLNVELIEYGVPDDERRVPPSSDYSVGHLAFAVDDVTSAGTYLRTKKVRMLAGPRTNREGPNAGQQSWFFLTPWNLALELVERPAVMPYERATRARLFER